MKYIIQTTIRLIFALSFIISGLNGFLQFAPPPQLTPQAEALFVAFEKTTFFFPLIKSIETVAGLFLLLNLYVPFAILLILPLLVGITLIHLFLNPAGLPPIIFLNTLHVFLAYSYREYFRELFTQRAKPS